MIAVGETRLELLVIQPSPFCNLDCDYCYLPARSSTVRMSHEVLRRTFESVFRSSLVRGPFTVVWHAGEPLAVPISFYEKALEWIRELNTPGVSVTHALQTNGTLIDPAWCDFFRRNEIRVGVSVDGPRFLHDHHRKTRRGGGTHGRVMKGIELLQRSGIDFHVITVLTAQALDHPDELFRFYLANGIRRVGFNFEETEGVHLSSTLHNADIETRARSFLSRFLALLRGSPGALELREFQGLARLVRGEAGFLQENQENTPFRILSVDASGNFSTFSPELLGMSSPLYGDFVLGNVLRDDLDQVIDTPKFKAMYADVAGGRDRCRRGCPYFAACGGGAPANKYFENGTFRSSETLHCRLSKKAVVDVVLKSLEESLAPPTVVGWRPSRHSELGSHL